MPKKSIFILESKTKYKEFIGSHWDTFKELMKICRFSALLLLAIHPLTGSISRHNGSKEFEESEIVEYRLVEVKRTKLKDIKDIKKLHERGFGKDD